MRRFLPALLLAAFLGTAAPCFAGQLQITVTNNQPAGGFVISPVWFGLSNGSFGAFDAGDNLKGSPYQSIAELGSSAALTTAFAGLGPQTTIGGSPIMVGQSAITTLDFADPTSTRFLNLAAMVVPSNDFFFGNDAAHPITLFNTAGQLIDAMGNATGTRTIQIFGAQVWDAGTEVNNINYGAAFVAGDNATDHVDANGTAELVFGEETDFTSYLNSIDGKLTPAGYNISHLISSTDLITTIQISSVPEPSTLTLASVGLIALVAAALKHRHRSVPA
jgi:hypothetical protein